MDAASAPCVTQDLLGASVGAPTFKKPNNLKLRPLGLSSVASHATETTAETSTLEDPVANEPAEVQRLSNAPSELHEDTAKLDTDLDEVKEVARLKQLQNQLASPSTATRSVAKLASGRSSFSRKRPVDAWIAAQVGEGESSLLATPGGRRRLEDSSSNADSDESEPMVRQSTLETDAVNFTRTRTDSFDAVKTGKDRQFSNASTAIPCDGEPWGRLISADSVMSAPLEDDEEEYTCPARIAADTQDWRSTTVTLRNSLMNALQTEAASQPTCPENVTADTPDWRPLTGALRSQLSAHQQKEAEWEAAQASVIVAAQPCPETITADTEDWRGLASTLRQAAAKVEEEKAAGKQACPTEIKASTADWRPLTATLRNALANAQQEETEKLTAPTEACNRQACPDEITAQTEDWRPLASSLRNFLKSAQEDEAARVCPEVITSETQDWRPVSTRLRRFLASAC